MNIIKPITNSESNNVYLQYKNFLEYPVNKTVYSSCRDIFVDYHIDHLMVSTPFLVGFDISKDILPPNFSFRSTITSKCFLIIDIVSQRSERIEHRNHCNDPVEAEHIDHNIQAFRDVNGHVVKIVAQLPSLYF